MKRFLIGVGLGAPLGVALILYIARMRMFYRIAVPAGPNGDYTFASGMCSTDQAIKQLLTLWASMGRDMGRVLVFGASSVPKLEESLTQYNRGLRVVAVEAREILDRGFSFSDKVVRDTEALLAQYQQPKTVGEIINGLTEREYRRWCFYRWMYHVKGKFNEFEGV